MIIRAEDAANSLFVVASALVIVLKIQMTLKEVLLRIHAVSVMRDLMQDKVIKSFCVYYQNQEISELLLVGLSMYLWVYQLLCT